MSSPDLRWVVAIRAEDRTGSLTAVTSVFASRGISFDSLTAVPQDGGGLITIEFTASDRLARVVCRTLGRLAVVDSLRLDRPGA